MRKNIPYNTENPSAEELLAFLKGSMNSSDATKMEQGMENDPMLSDALSGLREMKSPEKLLSIQHSLQTKITSQLIDKEPIVVAKPKSIWQLPTAYYAAAASIILILGFSFFFYNQTREARDIFEQTYKPAVVSPEISDTYQPENQGDEKAAKVTQDIAIIEDEAISNKDIAKTETKKSTEEPSIINHFFDKSPEKTEVATTVGESKDAPKTPNPSDERDKAELKEKFTKATQPVTVTSAPVPPPAVAPSANYAKKESDPKPVSPPKYAPILPSPAPANNMSNINTPSLSKKAENQVIADAEKEDYKKAGKTSTPKLKEKRQAKAPEQKADIAMEAEDYSSKEENISPSQNPDNQINDIYLNGLTKYEAKDYAGALEAFKKIPKNHSYRANADFFSANCYLSLNKQQEAIHLLKPLSEKANWNYQADAKWYLGMAYLANGQKKKAEEVLQKLLAEGGGTRKSEIEKVLREMGATE